MTSNDGRQQIVIAGSGFAGMWAAFSAARAAALAGQEDAVAITIVSPAPELHVRPRFYETAFDEMTVDLTGVLGEIGVGHRAGVVGSIAAERHQIEVITAGDSGPEGGTRITVPYNRFVLATGSQVFRPEVPGLAEHTFDIDQLAGARALDAHLRSLASEAPTPARNAVVVVGGGFTGIELAVELPERLRSILGSEVAVRVVMVEQATDVGPELGPGPRPVIEEALAATGVEVVTGTGVVGVDAGGVTLSDGRRIETRTVVWTAGLRAHPLAAQIEGEHDSLGRVHTDRWLHAKGIDDVFVTGDVARAAADDEGHVALMSCQHALILGRVAGHNAAAELVGLDLHPYSQPGYRTCLDLGPFGAVLTQGWDRQVLLSGTEAKSVKRAINTQLIYPPMDRASVFAAAAPDANLRS